MNKKIYIIIVCIALILITVSLWYDYKKNIIKKILFNISTDLRNSNIDNIDLYFTDKAMLSYKNDKYSIKEIKENLKLSKTIFRDMYLWNYNSKNEFQNIICWTDKWELDFKIYFKKNNFFNYKINKIELITLDEKNEELYYNFFIKYWRIK